MMTIKQIYDLAVRRGIEHDLRGTAAIARKLAYEHKRYERMRPEEKKEFDRESLTNPYSDTRMFAADPDKPVRRALVGIDMGTEELLLAKELERMGKPVDLIWSHHPVGTALAGLHEVMHMQAEIMETYGVPINIAESLIHIRMSEVARSVSPINHHRVTDAARILGFPMICTHTATDNMVATYLKRLFERKKRELVTVSDVMDLLKTIPEYQRAMDMKAGPKLYAGREDRFVGTIAVTEVTGGTEGSKDIYERLAQVGVGTIVGMHMQEEHKKQAEQNHLNVIIAGHMSSDSLGMNLFIDEVEKRGVEIIPVAGYIRVRRGSAPRRIQRRASVRRKHK